MAARKPPGTKGTFRDENQLSSQESLSSSPEGFIPPHGGYEQLHSFKKARIVYDGTVKFCNRFINKY
jgi:hypothetical protein